MSSNAIQQYFGETLSSQHDLKTGACCSPEAMPAYLRGWLGEIPREVTDRFYSCGSPIPAAASGATVVDLGSGTGRDAFLASRLVGPAGRVIGIDMTPQQLAVAERSIAEHRKTTGLDNIAFRLGSIEDLAAAGIGDGSVDVVISNCVLNLASDKARVLAEVFRALKPGGELYFSDVFADRRIPGALLQDPVLRGECLSGALVFDLIDSIKWLRGDHAVAGAQALRSP